MAKHPWTQQKKVMVGVRAPRTRRCIRHDTIRAKMPSQGCPVSLCFIALVGLPLRYYCNHIVVVVLWQTLGTESWCETMTCPLLEHD
jgi:hypothetical protein